MLEKRRSKRAPMNMELDIESLYKSGDGEVIRFEENVSVINISNLGMGFICSKELPLNNFFNAKVTIDDERKFYCVLKVIRSQKRDGDYDIGCEFVGLASILGGYIDEFVEETDEE